MPLAQALLAFSVLVTAEALSDESRVARFGALIMLLALCLGAVATVVSGFLGRLFLLMPTAFAQALVMVALAVNFATIILSYYLPHLLLPVGLLLLSFGLWQTRMLPRWGPALGVIAAAGEAAIRLLALSASPAAAQFGTLSAIEGAAAFTWAGFALAGSWTGTSNEEITNQPIRGVGLIGSLISRRTALTGVAMVLVFSLELDWRVALLFVLLIYAHELGHALAAIWRGVRVRGAPIFIPGLGAFAQTEERTQPWDEFWVIAGGPAFGTVVAPGRQANGTGSRRASPGPGRRSGAVGPIL